MQHTFHSEQWLPYSVEFVFAFFSNPENLPRLMPAWQKARIEEASFTPPPPRPAPTDPAVRFPGITAGAGTRLTLSFRPFPYSPVRVPWEAEICDFVWNNHFCDLQLRGPFASWKHCHSVHPESRDGQLGTLLTDHVDYAPPLGPLGELAHTLVLHRQLASTFDFRHKRTLELLALASR